MTLTEARGSSKTANCSCEARPWRQRVDLALAQHNTDLVVDDGLAEVGQTASRGLEDRPEVRLDGRLKASHTMSASSLLREGNAKRTKMKTLIELVSFSTSAPSPGILSMVFSMPCRPTVSPERRRGKNQGRLTFMTLSLKPRICQSVAWSCWGLIELGSWLLARMFSMSRESDWPSDPGSWKRRLERPEGVLFGSERALAVARERSEMEASLRWSPASPRSE